jgi:hypothetical protein
MTEFGEKWPVNLACDSDFHVDRWVLLHAQICERGQTALLPLRRKACCGFFFRPKKSDGQVRTRDLGYHFLLQIPCILECNCIITNVMHRVLIYLLIYLYLYMFWALYKHIFRGSCTNSAMVRLLGMVIQVVIVKNRHNPF